MVGGQTARERQPIHAFTLIEVMVVVTIIAILAALLFPALTQAKVAANKATDLMNIKQMVIAHQMYLEDYDGRTVTSWSFGLPGDFTFMVQPYIKDRSIMLSPGRTVSMEAIGNSCSSNLLPGGVDNPWGEPTMWGYGYNTGHDWDDGTGLTNEVPNTVNPNLPVTIVYEGKPITVQVRDVIKQGKLASEVASSAQVMLLGNTGDTTVQGLGRWHLTPLSMFTAVGRVPNACDFARLTPFPTWTDALNIGYVDGHVSLVHLDLRTLSWRIGDQNGGVRDRPKLFPNACQYIASYDGSNNPFHCATGDAH